MQDDRNLFSDAQDVPTNLPMAPASEDIDDGIFINWPGFDYDDNEAPADRDDDDPISDEDFSEDDGLPSSKKHAKKEKKREKKKAKNQKSKKNTDPETDDDNEADYEDYAFRRAADSDIAESRGKRKKAERDESELYFLFVLKLK